MPFIKIILFLLLSSSLLLADDQATATNDLTVERVAGNLVKMTGKYKLVFSITKDWKILHMTVTDLKDQPVLVDIAKIEISVRPDNRRTPFHVVMTEHPENQDGLRVTTHFEAKLNFIDEFKSFRVSTVVMIGDEKILSEYSFQRD